MASIQAGTVVGHETLRQFIREKPRSRRVLDDDAEYVHPIFDPAARCDGCTKYHFLALIVYAGFKFKIASAGSRS